MSCHIMSCRVMSCRVMSCVMTCHAIRTWNFSLNRSVFIILQLVMGGGGHVCVCLSVLVQMPYYSRSVSPTRTIAATYTVYERSRYTYIPMILQYGVYSSQYLYTSFVLPVFSFFALGEHGSAASATVDMVRLLLLLLGRRHRQSAPWDSGQGWSKPSYK